MKTETPLAVSRQQALLLRRRGAGVLAGFEAREDVFQRVSRWADLIASTLRVGPRGGSLVSTALARFGSGLARLLRRSRPARGRRGPRRAERRLRVPWAVTGRWETVTVAGRSCLRPTSRPTTSTSSCPDGCSAARPPACGSRSSTSASGTDSSACSTSRATARPRSRGATRRRRSAGSGEAVGLSQLPAGALPAARLRPRPHAEPGRVLPRRVPPRAPDHAVAVSLAPPPDRERFPAAAPVPELKKLPGRFYPINYLFIEITNACNFKCTWCPDEIMDRRRGFMKKEKRVPAARRDRAEALVARADLPGEAAPDGRADPASGAGRRSWRNAEERGVPIELNTNCGLITAESIDGALPRRPHQPDPVLPDARPRDASRRARRRGSCSTSTATRCAWRVERKVALGRAHEHRDRHHEHEVRRRLPHRQRGRAGARLPLATGSRSPQELESAATASRRARTTWRQIRERAPPGPGRERQPLRAARRRAPDLEALPLLGQRDRRPRRDAIVDTYCPAPYDQFVVPGTATW